MKIPVPTIEKTEQSKHVGKAPTEALRPQPHVVVPTFEITATDGDERKLSMPRSPDGGLLHVDYSPKQKESAKRLAEKHTIENVKLDGELRAAETATINEILEETEREKVRVIEESKETLREKLRQCGDDADEDQIEAVLLAHAQRLQTVAEQMEVKKKKQLEEARAKLAKERLRRKAELYQ